MKKIQPRGFTLIEILIVIGIIAVLAAIVIIAINPAKQFAQARNTQRQSNIETILNAIGQRMADNKGVFQGTFTIGTTLYTCGPLPAAGATTTVNTGMAVDATTSTGNLGCLVPTYVATLPTDPDSSYAVGTYTGYDVGVDASGRVSVCAGRAATESSLPNPGPICVKR